MNSTAARSELAGQVRAFVHWVGTGRKLTQTGRITLADARTLVAELGTDDEIDPTIGDRVFRTTSSQELLHLTLVVEWAKSARLVRKTGNRLVPMKKNAALLDDEPALWLALFTVFDQLGQAASPHRSWAGWRRSPAPGTARDHAANPQSCPAEPTRCPAARRSQ
jgi:hypothetical protein